ncbi:MAG: methyltransferase domain-containing protein [Pseudomonadota bacterium]|nr:methyltransferase domain-containing protein [Pseudomonadota bacterium]
MSTLPQINYTDIDLFSTNVKQKMNIIDLRFQNDHFDGIICSHVLEHVMDDHKALLELYRVIKVNGLALIMVPQDMSLKKTDENESITNPKDRYLRFGHPYHVRTCGSDYADRFTEVGFEVTQIDSRSLPRQRRRLYRLNKCIIYSCKKVREGSSPATDKTV